MPYPSPLWSSDAVSPCTAIYSLSRFSNCIQLDVTESRHGAPNVYLLLTQGRAYLVG